MEQIKIENLSFQYSLAEEKSLKNINLCIAEGEYVVLCGRSGCGKTTLLRQLKSEIAPKGKTEGIVLFNGCGLAEISAYDRAQKIGFVMQNPESQIVTDKVWHELAFSLESLGLKTDEIRLRVAEMAAYFGIEEWFDGKTAELSGGQKQLLNLASVMAAHPDVLILDEPTSRLDPIAAERFLSTVDRINKDLGVTVIITEHRLENILQYADRLVIMEKGEIIAETEPKNIGKSIATLPESVMLGLPAAARIFIALGANGETPLSVRDGRVWLKKQGFKKTKIKHDEKSFDEKNAVELKNISFRYEKNFADILKSLNLKIPKGCVFALLGGNGAGKTTLSKILLGAEKPYSGKLKLNGSICAMPQEVQTLFASKTVEDELAEVEDNDEKIRAVEKKTGVTELMKKHPFDISGGEQQRAALAKILLCERDIYLFDEPTKGMDAEFKCTFAEIIKELARSGKTVIIISHDIEFCAENAELCAMLFDGEIAAVGTAKRFFDGNRFYTTAANKISKGFVDGAVTDKDVMEWLKE